MQTGTRVAKKCKKWSESLWKENTLFVWFWFPFCILTPIKMHHLKNLKVIKKNWKLLRNFGILGAFRFYVTNRRVIFSIESAYVRSSGRGYLKAYRCVQGRGEGQNLGWLLIEIEQKTIWTINNLSALFASHMENWKRKLIDTKPSTKTLKNIWICLWLVVIYTPNIAICKQSMI